MRLAPSIFAILVAATLTGCAGQNTSHADGPKPNPDLARDYNAKGVHALEDHEYADAESWLRKATLADITNGPAHNNLGKAYYHQHKLYQAAWEFEYASRLMPYQPEPRNDLGLVLESTGRLDEAVDLFSKAMAIEPDNPEFIGNCARARVRRGEDSPEVRSLMTQLVRKDSRPEWVDWARNYLSHSPTTQP